jgi:hypothetical protein
VVTHQIDSLIDELASMLATGGFVTPAQLFHHFIFGTRAHGLIHARHGNSEFWRNDTFCPFSPSIPGNKSFGSIRTLWGSETGVI